MLLVIDTNILVNALKSSNDNAKSVQLMEDVFRGKHLICVSHAILEEYEDVLFRPCLEIPTEMVRPLLKWIRTHAFIIDPLPSSPEQVAMNDEDDRIFFDVAKCLNARLVTRNYKHFPVHELMTSIDELY